MTNRGWLVRSTDLTLRRVLELTLSDILFDGKSILLGDMILPDVPTYSLEYLDRRDQVFPKTSFLFPTLEGRSLLPAKYSKQFKGMLKSAGLEGAATHPKSLSDEQWAQVECIRFEKQRCHYQVILAAYCALFWGCVLAKWQN